MAYIRTNERLGGDPSFTVMWRVGGSRTGKTQRETFDDEEAAKRCRDLVNGHGQHCPPGWTKGVGFGELDQHAVPNSEMFRAYAHAHIKDGKPRPLHPPGTERRAYARKTIANLHGLLFCRQGCAARDPGPSWP
ncbi:hypothetical protein ACFC4C_15755 [Streptomyces sp. NPDC056039]|uniref:hypothetical protein n=1 Tax=Streptomyces sp. NPDC056039 TaxID=3345687 RepID=UPI0035DF1B59